MNNFTFTGRLSTDVELKYVAEDTPVALFSIAVNKEFKKDKESAADFFRITVWGKRAEACNKYISKGSLVLVSGRIQNNTYTDSENKKKYTNEFIAEDVEFLQSKKEKNNKSEITNNEQMEMKNSKKTSLSENIYVLTGVRVKTNNLSQLLLEPRKYVNSDEEYEKIVKVLDMIKNLN
ncbi:single-stranded DNA-binding protein [Criibacterium bergeronii]|uniref:Single-stranded DNA-binding protein n=1 Tax=Criibacterium bergeronii TaxID=1871336 RepID=A0A552VCC4_9FIRM|nr:single-stranded DNA-binding protein [Criibacterium bergeronii]TRW28050.1 single-stranded DNA-binding protein [Criibacterium bergeronii]